MEDVQGSLSLANLDLEARAGLPIDDRDEDLIVALAPEEPDIDTVVGALVEFVE
jgi:hypothetical protein